MPINPLLHERTKHIEGTCYFIQDYINKNRIKLYFVNTRNQQADNSQLKKLRFIQLRKFIGMMTKEKFDALRLKALYSKSTMQIASGPITLGKSSSILS